MPEASSNGAGGVGRTGISKRTRRWKGTGGRCSWLLCLLVTSVCLFYFRVVRTLYRNHELYHIAEEKSDAELLKVHLSRFDKVVEGELLLRFTAKKKDNADTKNGNSKNNNEKKGEDKNKNNDGGKTNASSQQSASTGSEAPPPTGECAINLFGLPRSFKHHVLPSLVRNVISVNHKYQCDYFVHFFNVTAEESGASETSSKSNDSTTQYARGGNTGGVLHPDDVYLLKDAVAKPQETSANSDHRQRVEFVSDTDDDFRNTRKAYIEEIIFGTGGNQSLNPYFVKEASFTEQTLLNILKMWHSVDRVWNLMDQAKIKSNDGKNNGAKRYKRVAMLRLDVIYTTPIDVYKVPTNVVPPDLNKDYRKFLKRPRQGQKAQKYFYDFGTAAKTKPQPQHCVVPGFKSFPVNDRYFAGPYEAVEIWAKDRFSRARKHVKEILPGMEQSRASEPMNTKKTDINNNINYTNPKIAPEKMTGYGLHDEIFVAHSILPAIRESVPGVSIHVDLELWFVRVRADGSIWLKDKPGYGRIQLPILEEALGRTCTGEVYEVLDPVLKDRTPGRWQVKCPP
mmetsp:Transcript_6149/g.15208  ORF Transcript_6149/g.15208 Transcript_6149/m.15208 type:complete len:567 (-) Transcript_6149:314-2014(-)